MSYKHFNAIINKEVGVEFHDFTERSIFLQCAYWSDGRGILRMPQVEIAQEVLLSVATIKRIFRQLEIKGFIQRLGHGRYQITDIAKESPQEASSKSEFRRWLKDYQDDAMEDGYITVAEKDIVGYPPVFHDALKQGWLVQSKNLFVMTTEPDEGKATPKPYIQYTIHV